MMKIDIEPVDLRFQKNIDAKHMFIVLAEKYIHYSVRFTSEEPIDRDVDVMAWERKPTSYDTWAVKDHVAGFEKSYISDTKIWCVSVVVSGYQKDLDLFFKKESEADNFVQLLNNWRFN